MNRLNELMCKQGCLTPAEEEEARRLWCEKNGEEYTPRPLPMTDDEVREKHGNKDTPWTIEFIYNPEDVNFSFPFVEVNGPTLSPHLHRYAFPEDWESVGHLIPEEKKEEIRKLFDDRVESKIAPAESMNSWITKVRGKEREHRIWSKYEAESIRAYRRRQASNG